MWIGLCVFFLEILVCKNDYENETVRLNTKIIKCYIQYLFLLQSHIAV